MTVTCTEFRGLRRGALYGFATFELQPVGLKLRDCTVMESNGKRWVGLPGKPQITREGTLRTDEHGKAQYTAIAEWTSRQRSEQFKLAALAALLLRYPKAYDEPELEGEPEPKPKPSPPQGDDFHSDKIPF